MSFTQAYANILLPFVENYKSAKNEKARKAVLETATKTILNSRNLLEDQGLDLPQDLKAATRRYIKGCLKKEKNPVEDAAVEHDAKPTKIKKAYTARDVVKQKYRSLVDKEIAHHPQTKEYLACYQRAVTTVLGKLDSAERKKVEQLAESWNSEGAPREVQFKSAKSKLPKDVKKKVDEWKAGSGALAICFLAYYDGTEVQAFHVESAPEVGNPFTHARPDWKEGTYEVFKDWAAKQFGDPRSEDEAEEEVPVEYQKAKNITFKRNETGGLILPPMSDYRKIRQKQRVVRAYAGAVYREFTGSSTSAFPYSLSAKTDQTIFSPECVPDGFCMSDPDHLTTWQINLLYAHWLKRQDERLAPLIILNASPIHAVSIKRSKKWKGKAKMEYVDVNTSDEDVTEEGDDEEEEDEDMDDNVAPVTKYGPPAGKRKQKPSSGPCAAHSTVAGPSTAPPLKHVAKTGKPSKPPNFESQMALITETTSNALNVSGPSKTKNSVAIIGPDSNQHEVMETSDGRRNIHADSLALADADRASDQAEPEGGLTTDVPAKRVETNGSKKVGRQATKAPGDDRPDAVGVSKLPKSSKQSKSSKLSGPSKPSKLEDKKRKHVDEQDLAAESSRDAKRIKKTDSSTNSPQPMPAPPKTQRKGKNPVSTRERPARVRGGGRVKEFPAGNTATSTSRIAFLNSLCSLPAFRALVELVQRVPRPSTIPSNYPEWASWKSREVYLPAEFHSASCFKNALSIGRQALEGSLLSEDGRIDAPLLLLGLMYREACRAMEIEPGAATNVPVHLSESRFGVKELEKIESMLGKVRLQSNQ